MRELIIPVLSLVIGVLVLLPAAIGPMVRPFKIGSLLLIFVLSALLAVLLLVAAMLASSGSTPGAARTADITHGLGNIAAIISLVAIAIFLGRNYLSDGGASPQILNLKINPTQPEVGKVVELEAEVQNRSGRPLRFVWSFDGRPVPGLRTAYIKLPNKSGTYLATVDVQNLEDPIVSPETGASTPDTSHSKSPQAVGARVWINVSEGAPTPGSGEPTAALNSIIEVCNKEEPHGHVKPRTVPKAQHRRPAPRGCDSPLDAKQSGTGAAVPASSN